MTGAHLRQRPSVTDLQNQFEQATRDIRLRDTRPDNDTLLKLYALYKQATQGDLSRGPPGFFDLVGTMKHQAWQQLHGVDREQAMRRYVALVQELLN